MITLLTQWIDQHSLLISALFTSSLVMLLLSALATPWAVAQLPSDYLLQRQACAPERSLRTLIIHTMRTMCGLLLILLGMVMMLLPGPGLICLLVGTSLASFPGKRKLLRYLASRESVFSSLNWMRERHAKPPLLHPFLDEN